MLQTYKKAPDKTRCIVAVTSSGAWHASQCKKPRGHGPEGNYCIMHSNKLIEKAAWDERRDAKLAEHKDKRDIEFARQELRGMASTLGGELVKRLVKIAKQATT